MSAIANIKLRISIINQPMLTIISYCTSDQLVLSNN